MYDVKYNKETEEFDIFRKDGSKLNSIKDPEMFVAMLPFIYNSVKIDVIKEVEISGYRVCAEFESILKENHPEMSQEMITLLQNVTMNTIKSTCNMLTEKACNKGWYDGKM